MISYSYNIDYWTVFSYVIFSDMIFVVIILITGIIYLMFFF